MFHSNEGVSGGEKAFTFIFGGTPLVGASPARALGGVAGIVLGPEGFFVLHQLALLDLNSLHVSAAVGPGGVDLEVVGLVVEPLPLASSPIEVAPQTLSFSFVVFWAAQQLCYCYSGHLCEIIFSFSSSFSFYFFRIVVIIYLFYSSILIYLFFFSFFSFLLLFSLFSILLLLGVPGFPIISNWFICFPL